MKRKQVKPHDTKFQVLSATGDELLTTFNDLEAARKFVKGTALIIQYSTESIKDCPPLCPPPKTF